MDSGFNFVASAMLMGAALLGGAPSAHAQPAASGPAASESVRAPISSPGPGSMNASDAVPSASSASGASPSHAVSNVAAAATASQPMSAPISRPASSPPTTASSPAPSSGPGMNKGSNDDDESPEEKRDDRRFTRYAALYGGILSFISLVIGFLSYSRSWRAARVNLLSTLHKSYGELLVELLTIREAFLVAPSPPSPVTVTPPTLPGQASVPNKVDLLRRADILFLRTWNIMYDEFLYYRKGLLYHGIFVSWIIFRYKDYRNTELEFKYAGAVSSLKTAWIGRKQEFGEENEFTKFMDIALDSAGEHSPLHGAAATPIPVTSALAVTPAPVAAATAAPATAAAVLPGVVPTPAAPPSPPLPAVVHEAAEAAAKRAMVWNRWYNRLCRWLRGPNRWYNRLRHWLGRRI